MRWQSHLVSLFVLSMILSSMAGCQTGAHQEPGNSNPAPISAVESAIVKLQQALSDFHKAQQAQDVEGMLQAVLARKEVLSNKLSSLEPKHLFNAKTYEMIDQIRSFVGSNETELAKIDNLFGAPKDRIIYRRLSSGAFFGGRSARSASGLTSEIYLAGSQVVQLPWSIDSNTAAIAYIEHRLGEDVELRLLDSALGTLCQEKNPSGHLICYWRAPPESRSTDTQVAQADR
ncbi:MAG: hypothetical protein AB8B81_21405, partial [Halioglobus sp.]